MSVPKGVFNLVNDDDAGREWAQYGFEEYLETKSIIGYQYVLFLDCLRPIQAAKIPAIIPNACPSKDTWG